jgi:NAD(P)-dependent dehydrogenase (short-subunit alcohol dehydrogenase family)
VKKMNSRSIADLLSFKNKTVMITGGCQNFGLEIATGFAEMGANLALTSRSKAKATQKAKEFSDKFGIKAAGFAMDVTDEKSVAETFTEAFGVFNEIAALVNNAGGHGSGTTGTLDKEPLSSWNGYLSTNMTGTFLCMREYSRHMMKKGYGSVVNIASVTSLLGRDRTVYEGLPMTPNPIPYTASKAGVIGLTYDAAAYLGKYGIRVNAISPGGFERGQPEKFVKAYSERTMLGRMGCDGLDLKGAAVFLSSDAAGYITGHNLYVDGGFSRFK